VWKDTYIFVVDCDKKVIAAHPIKPELVGQDYASLKDTKGKNFFPEGWCDAAKKPSGIWIEYWWPKPARRRAPQADVRLECGRDHVRGGRRDL